MDSRVTRAAVVALGALGGIYLLLVRPWHLRWGATDEEAARDLPGDELVPDPFLEATRAVTVRAPAQAIWPWLVQMGYRRAGWYSYDWIDNARIPSARRIIPELQDLRAGDLVPTDAAGGFTVAAVDPQRSLVLRIDHPRLQLSSSMVLVGIDAEHTRLINRLRARFSWSPLVLLYYLIFEPGDFIMMRKMLLGIRERAEAAGM